MKERVWINFKELRAKLKFEDVLRHYKVPLHRKGDQHQGPCPLPNHQGNRNTPSFSANLERGIFNCFSCGGTGNVLEFAALMSGIDLKDGTAFRKVAVELQTQLCPGTAVSPQVLPNRKAGTESKAINAPLDFALKDLDAEHPYLQKRGFSKDTTAYFGVGFCSRGMLKNRVAIPLHSLAGDLIGYSGRVVDDSNVDKDNPRYSFPKARERNGVTYLFDRAHILYNVHRIKAPCDDLTIVQGFPSVWWLHQCGFPNAIGVISEDVSEEQNQHIISLVRPDGRIRIMPDGDKAGGQLAQSLLRRLSTYRFVKWVKLNGEDRPSDIQVEKLRDRLRP